MNNGIKLLFAFTLGAAAGSVVTWKLVKDRYAQIADEEINSVKETFAKIRNADEMFESEGEPDSNSDEDEISEETKEEYEAITNNYKKGGSKPMRLAKLPYVITPTQFEDSDYPAATLTYYSNHVLVDEYGDVVDDIEAKVGINALNSFGDYEEDCVYVRNDEQGIDYEILRDEGEYSAVENNANPTFDE